MINDNYHKYFAINEEDKLWGIHVLDCGTTSLYSGTSHEYIDHPKKYMFSWENGRILKEYQLIYLLSGTGQFESKACQKSSLGTGDIILLFPEIWHRYRPDNSANWKTNWIGFDGDLARKIVPRLGISPERPFINIGYHNTILEIFNSVIEISKSEFSGFQQVLAGDVLRLLGWIQATCKKEEFKESKIDSIIHEAKSMLRNLEKFKQLQQIADDLSMGYSRFRKLFKDYTGLSPGQFRLHYLIKRAEILLHENHLSIQEICSQLGFESTQYFYRIFKKKTGKTPGSFRKQNNK